MGLEDELRQFSGTTRYYENALGLRFTDGVKCLADHAGCYWLIDLVASYQPALAGARFQLWEIEVGDDRRAAVSAREDSGEPALLEQQIEYTDFPVKRFEFYCVDGRDDAEGRVRGDAGTDPACYEEAAPQGLCNPLSDTATQGRLPPAGRRVWGRPATHRHGLLVGGAD